jgi:hypothetical protein
VLQLYSFDSGYSLVVLEDEGEVKTLHEIYFTAAFLLLYAFQFNFILFFFTNAVIW